MKYNDAMLVFVSAYVIIMSCVFIIDSVQSQVEDKPITHAIKPTDETVIQMDEISADMKAIKSRVIAIAEANGYNLLRELSTAENQKAAEAGDHIQRLERDEVIAHDKGPKE